MTRKRKGLLAILLTVLAALLASGIVLILGQQKQSAYTGHVAQGAKYLESGDYSSAILAYQAAIQENPVDEDAYLGLVHVYLSQGNTTLARSTLTSGISRTGGQRLRILLLTAFNDDNDTQTLLNETQPTSSAQQQSGSDALAAFCGRTFHELELNGGLASCSVQNGTAIVRMNAIPGQLFYYPTDGDPQPIDAAKQEPYGNKLAAELQLDDPLSIFGASGSIPYDALSRLSLTGLALQQNIEYGWAVTFRAQGCLVTIQSDSAGTVSAGAQNRVVRAEAGQDETESSAGFALSGTVTSATTGKGAAGARLVFQRSGSVVQTVLADSGGGYSVSLPDGDYSVAVSCDGYQSENFSVFVGSYQTETRQDFAISPTLVSGQIRIVLTWGRTPSDLDSYLDGKAGDGTEVHTNFSHKVAYAGTRLLAGLDLDDTDGYGPETTTIEDSSGSYTFTVHDYGRTGRISQSGATVKIYLPGSSDPLVASVPAGLQDDWKVCKIENGKVTMLS